MARETKQVSLVWRGGLRFEGGEAGRPAMLIDGDGEQAPGPMATLLLAAGACTGADVALILEKMRIRLTRFEIRGAGVRREEEPRRYVELRLTYVLAGAGLDEGKARRAIDLSIEKYCSVLHSLAPDITVGYDLVLE
ncbi:MAG: OsmC family protein [Gemmatimonadales bacterium]